MRRMDRYLDETENRVNRLEKNQDLYQDVANNTKVTNITDVTNANAFELSSDEGLASREKYQRMRMYNGMEDVPKVKKELEDFKYLYATKEKRIYDINSVLEEARKNRQEKDELEEKRKLKYTSYNIFAGVNLEELEKYRAEKKNREKTPEEEEIHDLMNTIASKTLAGELSKEDTVDLLSDLMATNMLDKVAPADEMNEEEKEEAKDVKEEIKELEEEEDTVEKDIFGKSLDDEQVKEEIDLEGTEESQPITIDEVEERNNEEPTEENKKLDSDFYTKSMDLSTSDLEIADDFKDPSLPVFIKILIVFLILAIIAMAIYFVYLKIK